MNKIVKGIIIFLAGGAAGSVATYFAVREHFRNVADEEIDSVMRYCSHRITECELSVNDENKFSTLADDPDVANEYIEKLKELGYLDDDDDADDIYDDEREEVNPVDNDGREPELIDAQIFISQGQDMQETLHYYIRDDVICDDQYEVMDNWREILGEEWKTALDGEDSVFVRNFERETDFEILIFDQSYENAIMGDSLNDSDDEEEEEDDGEINVKQRMADKPAEEDGSGQ